MIDTQRAADTFVTGSAAGVSGGGGSGWERLLFADRTSRVVASGTGRLDAIVYWFDLELTPRSSSGDVVDKPVLTLSTGPGGGSYWKQAATGARHLNASFAPFDAKR